MTDPTPADLAAFGASEAACYLYPGTDQQPLRAAYCAGAASMAGTFTPLNLHKTDNRGIEMTEAAEILRKAKEHAKNHSLNECLNIVCPDRSQRLACIRLLREALEGEPNADLSCTEDKRSAFDRAIALAEKSDV